MCTHLTWTLTQLYLSSLAATLAVHKRVVYTQYSLTHAISIRVSHDDYDDAQLQTFLSLATFPVCEYLINHAFASSIVRN